MRVGGLKVRYLDASEGTTVLLLHGIGHSVRAWGRAMPALADAGFRAIALDTPGFGYSEQPAEIWDEDALVGFLDDFLDTFYLDRVSVGGHSLGGAFAAIYGLRRPERVNRLALVSAAIGPDVTPALRLLTLQLVRPMLRPLALRQAFSLFAGSWEPAVLEQELADAQRWLSDEKARVYFWNVLRQALRIRGIKPEYLILSRLAELKPPALIAWGKKDWVLPFSNVEKIRAHLPGARYETFEDAGHMIPFDEPERFNRVLIEFLRG